MVVFYTAGIPLTRTRLKRHKKGRLSAAAACRKFSGSLFAFRPFPRDGKHRLKAKGTPPGFLSQLSSFPYSNGFSFVPKNTRRAASRRPFLLCVLGGRKRIGFGRTLCLMIRYPRIFAELCVWCEQFVNVWKKSTLFSKIQLRGYLFPHPPGIHPGKTAFPSSPADEGRFSFHSFPCFGVGIKASGRAFDGVDMLLDFIDKSVRHRLYFAAILRASFRNSSSVPFLFSRMY